MKICLDLAEIDSMLKKLDWHDGGGGKQGSPTTFKEVNITR